MHIEKEIIATKLSGKIFETITSVADNNNLECYVIGGYVRDIL